VEYYFFLFYFSPNRACSKREMKVRQVEDDSEGNTSQAGWYSGIRGQYGESHIF